MRTRESRSLQGQLFRAAALGLLALSLGALALESSDAGSPPAAASADALQAHAAAVSADAGAPASDAEARLAAADPEPPLVGGELDMIQVPSAPEAWGGERTGSEPELSQRVASYDLHALLDPKAHTVEGRETLRWTNRSAVPIRAVYLHLYLNAFEGPHTTFMSEKGHEGFRDEVETKKGEWGYIDLLEIAQGANAIALPGAPAGAKAGPRSTFVHPDGGPSTDRTVLRVELPTEVPPGATTELTVRFHDQLPRVIARTGWFDSFHLVGQWFPKIGVLELPGERGATSPRWNVHELHLNSEFYADFGSYDLEVTAPAGFTVAAMGVRVGEPRETPAGVVHRFHQDDIHDAVFAAWDKYPAPLAATYTGANGAKTVVETYFPSEFARSGAVAQQATLDSLKYFSDTLGAYPYPHITVVIPPYNASEAGGMEYETFFTSEGSNGVGAATDRFVGVHEFGHGYFMGLLASNEFEEPFLDEGLNEFWDARMLSEGTQFEIGWLGKLGFRLPAIPLWDSERIGAVGHFLPDPLAATSWHRYSSGSYGSVYARSVVVFHDLEAQLGGDELARGMKLYYQRWHHRHPSAADLRAALEDACSSLAHKQLVHQWFDAQVYAVASIDDSVRVVESEELVPEPGTELRDGKRIELDGDAAAKEIAAAREKLAQERGKSEERGEPADAKRAHPSRAGPFPFRSIVKAQRRGMQVAQTLRVRFEDGSEQTVSWPPGEVWHKWVFEGPARVEWAQLDPEGQLLLDINKFDDGRTRQPKSKAAHRWALEIAAWMQLLYSFAGGL